MYKPETSNVTIYIDYIPAELRENKTWEIVYYVKNPFTEKLERKRNRVKPLNSIMTRRKLAKIKIDDINKRLQKGWNPFYEKKGSKELTKLFIAFDIYIKMIELEVKDKNLRKPTLKTYKSFINLLKTYINDVVKTPDMFCYKFDEEFVGSYLDYIRYDKGNSARTRDNHLSFINTICEFFIKKKYLMTNPTEIYSKINKQSKKRVVIPKIIRIKIFNYWKEINPQFLTLCLCCYYCLVRRTELTKLRVGDISIKNSTLYIDASDSKNRRSAHVTIPNELLPILAAHIRNSNSEDYLFSRDSYRTGVYKLGPDRITKDWSKMRTRLGINNNYHWYSLKDTGITDLLLAGMTLISVRDQARHYSIKQTEEYTPREMLRSDENIKASGIKF